MDFVNFALGNNLFWVVTDIRETAAPMSTSIRTCCPLLNCNGLVIVHGHQQSELITLEKCLSLQSLADTQLFSFGCVKLLFPSEVLLADLPGAV